MYYFIAGLIVGCLVPTWMVIQLTILIESDWQEYSRELEELRAELRAARGTERVTRARRPVLYSEN